MSKNNLLLASIAASILLSPAGIDIIQDIKRQQPDLQFVLSSNLRGTDRQAKELARMLSNGKDLSKLYKASKATLDAIKRGYISGGEAGIQEVLDEQQSRGIFMSSHLCGRAIDIYPLKESRLTMRQLYDRVKLLRGYKVINEGNHIHIQTLKGCNNVI